MKQSNSVAEFCTVADAAKKLGVAERTIYGEVKKGNIPAIRVGKAVRIKLSYFDIPEKVTELNKSEGDEHGE